MMPFSSVAKGVGAKTAYLTAHGAVDQRPDEEKLRTVALYVASRSEDDPAFDRTKLERILFYADVLHYLTTGRSITGSAYVKGPFPLPEGFGALQRTMDEAGELKLQQRLRYGSPQKRPVALVIPDLSRFDGAEVATVVEAVAHGREGD